MYALVELERTFPSRLHLVRGREMVVCVDLLSDLVIMMAASIALADKTSIDLKLLVPQNGNDVSGN